MPRAKAPALKPAEARKYLARVPDEVVFWVHDDGALHDLAELAGALETMADDTYAHHANATKNDFVNWVRDVVSDQTLVTDLARAANRAAAAAAVQTRLARLRSAAA